MRHFWDVLVQWGPSGVFLISAIDSVGVPNPGITDVALILAAIASPANGALCAALAVLGSVIGAMIFFEIALRGGEKYLQRFTASGAGLRFRAWFLRYGLLTVFISALLPLPFLPLKVFMACAGAMGESRIRFMLVLAAGRIPRYFALVYLGVTLGQNSGAWIKGHLWQMGIFAVILFAALYVLIQFAGRKHQIE
jgi:membrane protein YqaA with SNARE-associated domain